MFFSRLITVSGLKEHQRSHCTYIFLRDRPLFIFWKGQRGVGGRGAIKIYPILHTSLGCSCDRPSWRRLIPPSFPLKTVYLSLPPPPPKKKKEEEEKENFTPPSPHVPDVNLSLREEPSYFNASPARIGRKDRYLNLWGERVKELLPCDD